MAPAILVARDLAIGYASNPRATRSGLGRAPKTESSLPGKSAPFLLFDQLDLELCPGRLVALLGPNGAGKSTLLRTLAGIQSPWSGRLELQGRALAEYPANERARHLAVVLTTRPDSGRMTVAEMVALGRYPHTDWLGRLTSRDHEQIDEALHLVDAHSLADCPLEELSDGEYQRVALARALAQQAEILLLDEITAFLDLPRRVEILFLLRRLAHAGRAILLTTHDLELAMRAADELWLLGRGGSFSRGAPEELALGGEMGKIFADDIGEGHPPKIVFELETGSFRFPSPQRGTLAFEGEGSAAFWTLRALDRLGYGLAADSDIRVKVEAHATKVVWWLEVAGHTRTFDGLTDLLNVLRED